MRALLALAATAAALIAAPAVAVEPDQQAFVGNPAATSQAGGLASRHDRGFRRHFNDEGTVLVYDRDYEGDSAWRSNSFNDWWHDRPDRAYPHWMMSNQNCEKQWFQGDVLRC